MPATKLGFDQSSPPFFDLTRRYWSSNSFGDSQSDWFCAVLERHVDGPVGARRDDRGLGLVALTPLAFRLEGAEVSVRARDLLRLRPVLAAVVAVALHDRRLDVLAEVRDERSPRHVRAPVVRRVPVVIGRDPFLVVEDLERVGVAALAEADDLGLVPVQSAVLGERDHDVAVAGLAGVVERVVQRRVQGDVMLDVDRRNWIAARPGVILGRHVPGRPARPRVERRVVLVAARAVVVRARDHVPRIRVVNDDVRLVVREWVVAVEVGVEPAREHGALGEEIHPAVAVLVGRDGDLPGHPEIGLRLVLGGGDPRKQKRRQDDHGDDSRGSFHRPLLPARAVRVWPASAPLSSDGTADGSSRLWIRCPRVPGH